MNKKGFAISVILYTMVLLIIAIFYLLLGIVRNRYMVVSDLKDAIIDSIEPGGPPESSVLSDIIEKKLPLTDPDIDGTRYVYGQTEDNYLWYSGKLWRIVSINRDGSIKLVTQGNMTALAWSTKSSLNYSTSQIHNWLKNEFLPTLANADVVLVDANWDYTAYESLSPKEEVVNIVENEKVGLLNVYDYYKVRNGSNSNFLNNGYFWWTMSPYGQIATGGGIRCVWYDGSFTLQQQNKLHGVRPSVNLISDIRISGGTGEVDNPYTIEGDKAAGTTSELLSNRISGEYINFNDVLYRIVSTEEINGQKLTKVMMADYSVNSNTIGYVPFGSDANQRIFSPTYGIGLYLKEWYQADNTSETYASTYIKDDYKMMIATDGIKWYIGPTNGLGVDYTLSKTGTPVSATIGLGYYGEMFSSQFGDGYNLSTGIYLITVGSSCCAWDVFKEGNASNYVGLNGAGVRPSFYLKSNVKITGGNGMPQDPYTLTQ